MHHINDEQIYNQSSASHQANNDVAHKNDDLTSSEKNIAALSYLIFFLPLILKNKSEFVKFHFFRALLLFLFYILINLAGWLIKPVGTLVILPIGTVVFLLLLIYGVLNATRGKRKWLPMFRVFKINL